MLNFFNKGNSLQKKWNAGGESFARQVNEMVEFGETHGWENWKEKEPEDKRQNLADDLLDLLLEANKQGTVADFRKKFPPAHDPFVKIIEKKRRHIQNLHFVGNDSILFMLGVHYEEKRQAYLLSGGELKALSKDIVSIGKSPVDDVFAVCVNRVIVTYKGWGGEKISSFSLPEIENLPVTELIPFNDGKRVLLVSSEGIYLLTPGKNILLHPEPDPDDKELTSHIDMEHASLSPDNTLIALGDQGSEHRILDENGNQIAQIGPQSSYPHFTLFSKDGKQVSMNSCHFYNGVTIGVPTKDINGLMIEAYKEDERYVVIDDDCRVYAGVATSDYYIVGDAYGYIRAFTKEGKKAWRHFLGSTITGMAVSADEMTLWIGTYAGILHKLQLNKGHRDTHTIGNGNHYEEFRLLFWESQPLFW